MTSPTKNPTLRPKAQTLEWHVCEDERDWHDAQSQFVASLPAEMATPQWTPARLRRWAAPALCTLLTLALLGGWLWHRAQSGLAQINEELRGTVQAELSSTADPATGAWQAKWNQEQTILGNRSDAGNLETSRNPPTNTAINTEVHTANLSHDLAVINLVTTAGASGQTYRQTRFYRETTEGWQRTKPDEALWGAPRILESSHFIFHYRQNDAQVVDAVAPQMDDLYAELQRNFDLTPDAEKMDIEVRVEQEMTALFVPLPRTTYFRLVVPSPAVYLAPVDLSDDAILAQSIALPLIDYMGRRFRESHGVLPRWRSLLFAVQLWQLWDVDMPLARWRQDVVNTLYIDVSMANGEQERDKGGLWIGPNYIDQPMANEEQGSFLPARYAELCMMHSLWMLAPRAVGIPLGCTPSDRIHWSRRWRSEYATLTPLEQLDRPYEWESPEIYSYGSNIYRSNRTVAAATLVEYAVATYGYEQLPILLSALGQYDDWDTLLPAVFGVSSSEFEEGWLAYVMQEYSAQK